MVLNSFTPPDLTELSSLDSGDWLLAWDSSAGVLKKLDADAVLGGGAFAEVYTPAGSADSQGSVTTTFQTVDLATSGVNYAGSRGFTADEANDKITCPSYATKAFVMVVATVASATSETEVTMKVVGSTTGDLAGLQASVQTPSGVGNEAAELVISGIVDLAASEDLTVELKTDSVGGVTITVDSITFTVIRLG